MEQLEIIKFWLGISKRAFFLSLDSIGSKVGLIIFVFLCALFELWLVFRLAKDDKLWKEKMLSILKGFGVAILVWLPFYVWSIAKIPFTEIKQLQLKNKQFENNQNHESLSDIRKKQRNQVSELYKEAIWIRMKCQQEKEENQTLGVIADKWSEKMVRCLERIDMSYAARFVGASEPSQQFYVDGVAIPKANNNVLNVINRRLKVVDQILKELNEQ